MGQRSVITKLKNYFASRDDVLMAFLFGSHARGYSTKRSDWDIGVYLQPRSRSMEWETNEVYPQEGAILTDLTDILKTDAIDLVVLNNASASIADTAIQGLPITVKDRELFLDFMLAVSREAEDYRETAQDYADIYWRSKSLTPEDRERLNKHLIFLDSELLDSKEFSQMTQFEYQSNKMKKRAVERWIENIMMATVDISKIILASQRHTVPNSYTEIMRNICFFFNFSEETAFHFIAWTKLRNIVAHEYLDLRWIKEIRPFIDKAPLYFDTFIEAVKLYLKNSQ